MLFVAADDDFGLDDVPEQDAGASPRLDSGELSDDVGSNSPSASDKVELDLEDAPFLDEEEEEEEQPEEQPAEPAPPPISFEEPKKPKPEPFWKKLIRDKRILFGGGGAVLLFLIILLTYILWPSGKPTPEEEPAPPTEQNATPQPAPAPEVQLEPEEPPAAEQIVSWEPFWVEYIGDDGTPRFLRCKFAAPTDNERLAWEITRKQTVLRDAIFYYLRNKELVFLADKNNVEQLKRDLLSVINQYLTAGQLEQLLIEEYLIK